MLKIDNLSNEIDAAAVRGGSVNGFQGGPAQILAAGAGSLVAGSVNNGQLMSQGQAIDTTNYVTTVFGQTAAGVTTWNF